NALHLAWFFVLFIAWGWAAGQSGSPVPDNWPLLERFLDVLWMSTRLSLLLLVLAPVAWYAASKDSRWSLGYPILLFLLCGVTVMVDGTIEGGALRFHRIGVAPGRGHSFVCGPTPSGTYVHIDFPSLNPSPDQLALRKKQRVNTVRRL